MTDHQDLVPFDPTARCAKCGGEDISAMYQDQWHLRCESSIPHIDRSCRRCLFRWVELPLDALSSKEGVSAEENEVQHSGWTPPAVDAVTSTTPPAPSSPEGSEVPPRPGGRVMRTVNYADLTDADREGVVFWDDIDAENPYHDDLDEAIEGYIEYMGVPDHDHLVRFAGFKRMEMWQTPESDEAMVLEYLLERWDEDHGDPDGDSTTPTDAMKAAARAFIATMRAEYQVWACEPVLYVDVPVREWIEKHRPEWLQDQEAE